jgi:hypothetical protein
MQKPPYSLYFHCETLWSIPLSCRVPGLIEELCVLFLAYVISDDIDTSQAASASVLLAMALSFVFA